MVRVDGQVQAHKVNEVLVSSKTELVGQVETIILVSLGGGDLTILVDVAVDLGGNGGELSNQVHGVLEGVVPVVFLVDALRVRLGELRLVLKRGNSKGELGHGVEGVGAAVDELLNELGDLGAGSPLGGELADLGLGGDLTGQEKPEETLGEGLLSSGSAGKDSLALGDLKGRYLAAARARQLPIYDAGRLLGGVGGAYGLATEADTLISIENGSLQSIVSTALVRPQV